MPALTFRQVTSRPAADGRCRVLLDVNWDAERVKLPTGVSCLPANFKADAKPGQWVKTYDYNSTALNKKLSDLLGEVLTVFGLSVAHKTPVTVEQISALAVTKRKKKTASPLPSMPAEAALPDAPTFVQLLQQWKDEHPTASKDSARRYNQVVAALENFHPGFALHQLTRPVFLRYLAYLAEEGLADSTISQHVKFLRNCLRMREKAVPLWLVYVARYGRALSLKDTELLALRTVKIPESKTYLERERERTLFQIQLLLRDSDLRKIRPHHVAEEMLPGVGPVLMLRIYQKKTGDEMRFPLPPLSEAIWKSWKTGVPMITQQDRNKFMKEWAELAGLDREFMRVRFRKGVPVEELRPVHELISTHALRHAGADMIIIGSGGDQHLKEIALGHAGPSVYGLDTVERYGPLLLRAWANVGAMSPDAPSRTPKQSGAGGTCRPVTTAIRPVLARFTGLTR